MPDLLTQAKEQCNKSQQVVLAAHPSPHDACDGTERDLTSQHFRFFDLPQELRAMILLQALGPEIYPISVYSPRHGMPRVSFGFGDRDRLQILGPTPWEDDGVPNPAVFLVCKRMREEAWQAALIGTSKHFHTNYAFENVVTCQLPPAPPSTNWLSKVTLHLGLEEYFNFFGWEFGYTITPSQRAPQGRLLAQIPMLEELTLDFPNPYIGGYNGGYNDEWIYAPRSCYLAVIDMLLVLGFPFLRGLDVRLQGVIKPATKQAWTRILSIEHRKAAGKSVFESHGFDYDSALARILSIPMWAMPPNCHCPQSCKLSMFRYSFIYGHSDEALTRIRDLIDVFDHDDSSAEYGLIEACKTLDQACDEEADINVSEDSASSDEEIEVDEDGEENDVDVEEDLEIGEADGGA